MATDPQTLLDEAKCYACFVASGQTSSILTGLVNFLATNIATNQANDPGSNGFQNPTCPVPTGFTFVWNSTLNVFVATWDAPPAGVTATDVFISQTSATTGFHRYTTVAAPGTSANISPPASGTQEWCMIRWKCANGNSAFTSVLSATESAPIDPVATDWRARVIANGGANPSDASVLAISDFVTAIAAFSSKMISVLVYAPDSLIAALTPVYKVAGNDPWTNHNFLAADLTINGLVGDGTALGAGTKYLDSGCKPSLIYPNDLSAGISVYLYSGTGNASNATVVGTTDIGFNTTFGFWAEFNNNTYFFCWNGSGPDQSGWVQYASTGFHGFITGNRTSATAGGVYKANSVTPFALQKAFTGSNSTRYNQNIFAFDMDANGGPAANSYSNWRQSFLAIHTGLTAAEAQTFYNAVQALRVAFGGGFI